MSSRTSCPMLGLVEAPRCISFCFRFVAVTASPLSLAQSKSKVKIKRIPLSVCSRVPRAPNRTSIRKWKCDGRGHHTSSDGWEWKTRFAFRSIAAFTVNLLAGFDAIIISTAMRFPINFRTNMRPQRWWWCWTCRFEKWLLIWIFKMSFVGPWQRQ